MHAEETHTTLLMAKHCEQASSLHVDALGTSHRSPHEVGGELESHGGDGQMRPVPEQEPHVYVPTPFVTDEEKLLLHAAWAADELEWSWHAAAWAWPKPWRTSAARGEEERDADEGSGGGAHCGRKLGAAAR